jgi:hypothetical protein
MEIISSGFTLPAIMDWSLMDQIVASQASDLQEAVPTFTIAPPSSSPILDGP